MTRSPRLLAEYGELWDRARVRLDREAELHEIVGRISAQRERYERVAESLGGLIPWEWIGAIHNMESSLNFRKHLHNGDSLSARTRRKPAGRPVKGEPPFTWEESAIDALRMKGLHRVEVWTVGEMLYQAERYNGWGYRRFHPDVLSPYLWAGTTLYSRGKYVADGKWSSSAVSKQMGVAAILMAFFITVRRARA